MVRIDAPLRNQWTACRNGGGTSTRQSADMPATGLDEWKHYRPLHVGLHRYEWLANLSNKSRDHDVDLDFWMDVSAPQLHVEFSFLCGMDHFNLAIRAIISNWFPAFVRCGVEPCHPCRPFAPKTSGMDTTRSMDHQRSALDISENTEMGHTETGTAGCGFSGSVGGFASHHLATIPSGYAHRSPGQPAIDTDSRLRHQLCDGKFSVCDLGTGNYGIIQSLWLVLDGVHEVFERMDGRLERVAFLCLALTAPIPLDLFCDTDADSSGDS